MDGDDDELYISSLHKLAKSNDPILRTMERRKLKQDGPFSHQVHTK